MILPHPPSLLSKFFGLLAFLPSSVKLEIDPERQPNRGRNLTGSGKPEEREKKYGCFVEDATAVAS